MKKLLKSANFWTTIIAVFVIIGTMLAIYFMYVYDPSHFSEIYTKSITQSKTESVLNLKELQYNHSLKYLYEQTTAHKNIQIVNKLGNWLDISEPFTKDGFIYCTLNSNMKTRWEFEYPTYYYYITVSTEDNTYFSVQRGSNTLNTPITINLGAAFM